MDVLSSPVWSRERILQSRPAVWYNPESHLSGGMSAGHYSLTRLTTEITIHLMVIHIELNNAQLDRLSEILGNFGLIVFASVVFPTLIGSQTYGYIEFWAGLIISAGCVATSVAIMKGGVS